MKKKELNDQLAEKVKRAIYACRDVLEELEDIEAKLNYSDSLDWNERNVNRSKLKRKRKLLHEKLLKMERGGIYIWGA